MKSGNENTGASNTCRVALLIALAILAKYLFVSTRSTLWDRDEPHFTRAVVEMVESGNYLVPTFNRQMWPDKPPLLYWLMSVPVRLLGPTEFAWRVYGTHESQVPCLLIFLIGQRLFGTKAGLWAMVILASTLMVLVIGTAATTDAVLLPINVAIMLIFAQSAISGVRPYHVILMGLVLGLGMLTKGPIGLMPIPAIATIFWFDRKNRKSIWRDVLLIGISVAIGFLIFSAWAIEKVYCCTSCFARELLRIIIYVETLIRILMAEKSLEPQLRKCAIGAQQGILF